MIHDAPICLNASVLMPRGNGGLDVDLAAMQSTSRNWLKITELRVFIDPGEASVGATPGSIDLGFMVDVAITVGTEDLTTGFIGTPEHPTGERIAYVPAFLLGPRIYRRFSTVLNGNAVYVAGMYAAQNMYSWTLPRPLFVPPNTPIKFKVRRTSSVALLDVAAAYPDAFTVEVSAVGTRLAAKPNLRVRNFPHIHAWSPRNIDATRVESGEAFRNLHKQSLNLTRIVAATAMNYGISIESATQDPVNIRAGVIADPTLIQIYDGNGNDVVVSVPPVPLDPGNPMAPVPISSLFLAKTNSVRISDRLQMNQTYRMVASPVAAGPLGFGGFGVLLMPMVGLESFREVPT